MDNNEFKQNNNSNYVDNTRPTAATTPITPSVTKTSAKVNP